MEMHRTKALVKVSLGRLAPRNYGKETEGVRAAHLQGPETSVHIFRQTDLHRAFKSLGAQALDEIDPGPSTNLREIFDIRTPS